MLAMNGTKKVSRFYNKMMRVFEIVDRNNLRAYQTADRLTKERLAQTAQVKNCENSQGAVFLTNNCK